jgi:electron transfer flavoprotein beta subunit
MNIIVTLKQTFDTEAKIVLKDGKIDPAGVKLVINTYDEFAIEEALKIKEAAGEGEVILVSVSATGDETSLRTGLAIGADRAILVSDPAIADADEYAAAEILAKAIATEDYDLILSGRIAVDDQSAQVAVRAAEVLGLPSVSSILKLDLDGGKAIAVREIDGGAETVEVPLPAVLTAQKGLNEPRLPSMKGIMASKRKEIKRFSLTDLGVNIDAKAKSVDYSLPTPRAAGKIIDGEPQDAAAELAKLLREEAKVI